MADILKQVDLFFPNEDEVVGIATATGGPANTVEDAVRHLSSLTLLATVATLGSKGAMIGLRDGGLLPVEPYEGVHVRDSTGCGDAFDAGFLHAWLQGAELEEATKWGSAVACKCATVIGASEAPCDPVEIKAYVRSLDAKKEDRYFEQQSELQSLARGFAGEEDPDPAEEEEA